MIFKGIRIAAILVAVTVFCSAGMTDARAQSAFDDPGAQAAGGAAGGAGIVPAEPNVDGGTIGIGSTAQVVVLFENQSGRPVQTGAIQLYPSSSVSATISMNQCGLEPLEAGAVCAIALSVKALQAGPWRIEMLMRHDGRSRLVTTTITGTVDVSDDQADQFRSDIETIPSAIDFGNLNRSSSLVRSIILRNTTSETINIEDMAIESPVAAGFSLKGTCEELAPGQACIATVQWSPQQAGPASGVLMIMHDGATRFASVNLDGEYQPQSMQEATIFPDAVPGKGLLVSSEEEIEFGTGINSASAITLSMVNLGDAPLTIKDIRLGGGDNGLNISAKGCKPETVLEPIAACPITLTWTPVREGNLRDDLQIIHDGARGILVLPVSGDADAIVNQSSQTVRIAGPSVASLPSDGVRGSLPPPAPTGAEGEATNASQSGRPTRPITQPSFQSQNIDASSVLDGFNVTSHAPTRAIIAGPGGSRIVFDGQEVVIGGVLWYVGIQPSGVSFSNGVDTVLLLFDRSLSSLSQSARSSGSNTAGSASAAP